MRQILKIFGRRTHTLSANLSPTLAEFDAMRAERDGYKNAYETLNTEIGQLRMAAAPWVRSPECIPPGPSIFVVTLAKSGTVYIGQTLRQSLGYDFTSTLVTPMPFKNVVWPTMAWDFARGGMVSVSHMQADEFNLKSIRRAGITKGILHIRDPRAAMYSWLHFGTTVAEQRNGKVRIGDVGAPPDPTLLARPVSERIDELLETYLFHAVQWIEAWVEILERNDDLNFMICSQDRLSSDPAGYFAAIFNFYELQAQPIVLEKSPNTHFRSGDNDEWRAALSPDKRAALIP